MPSFVPSRYAARFARAAQRWNVSAALLAAQVYAESNFNPFAISTTGARGIAQFMPSTGRAYGLVDPFDPDRSIDAQAHLMRDFLRRFASVPLALKIPLWDWVAGTSDRGPDSSLGVTLGWSSGCG